MLALSNVGVSFGYQPSAQSLAAEPVTRVDPPVTTAPAVPGPSVSTSARSANPPARTDVKRMLTTVGGDVVAQCRGEDAYLVYWIPKQGYRTHDVVRGPAEVAKLQFKGHDREIELKIKCDDGVPRLKIEDEREDEGR